MSRSWLILWLLLYVATTTIEVEPKDWSGWSRVPKFRGYVTVVTKFDTQRETGLANGRETSFEVETTTVRFVLERDRNDHPVQMSWIMTEGEVAFRSLMGKHYRNDLGDYSSVLQQGEYHGPPARSA